MFLFDFNGDFFVETAWKNKQHDSNALFRKSWYIKSLFLWPSKKIYLLQNIHKTMFCISKYMMIHYQLAPCCMGLGLWHLHMIAASGPMMHPTKSWHGPSLVKPNGEPWNKGKGFFLSRCWRFQWFLLEFSPRKIGGRFFPFSLSHIWLRWIGSTTNQERDSFPNSFCSGDMSAVLGVDP